MSAAILTRCLPVLALLALPHSAVAETAQKHVEAPPAHIKGRALPDSFAELARQVGPAVVNISTTQTLPDTTGEKETGDLTPFPPGSPFNDFFRDYFGRGGGGQPSQVQSLGSGFVIDPSGLIVTNNHVIAGADEINVILSDDTSLKAQVAGRDPVTDLALLRVTPKSPLPTIAWGDSNRAEVGDWVVAVGNPFGLGGSVTAGIVSARARDIHAGPYDDFLQTDAPINRGNSGGPLVNLSGEVIGINTAIFSPTGGSIGIGFAIPSTLARSVIEQLRISGKVERGWIGVHIQPVTPDIADSLGLDRPRGALVTDVDPNGPAAKAKLMPGDVILSFDNKPIERSRLLPRVVADSQANHIVRLALWRDGRDVTADIKVGALGQEQPAASPQPTGQQQKEIPTLDVLGMALAKITPDLRRDLELSETSEGVAVIDVQENSVGAKHGVLAGDIITALGREAVATPEQIAERITAARKTGRKSILLHIERDGESQFLALPL